jgi:hypothetical protein
MENGNGTNKKIETCPRGYVPLTDALPKSCCAHCPIVRGEQVADLHYTVSSAVNSDTSPLYGYYNIKSGAKYGTNQAVFRGSILTVSIDPTQPKQTGRKQRVIPQCALVAYRKYVESRAENGKNRRAAAERQKELKAQGIKRKASKKNELSTREINTRSLQTD